MYVFKKCVAILLQVSSLSIGHNNLRFYNTTIICMSSRSVWPFLYRYRLSLSGIITAFLQYDYHMYVFKKCVAILVQVSSLSLSLHRA